jgi:hypothetical protein
MSIDATLLIARGVIRYLPCAASFAVTRTDSGTGIRVLLQARRFVHAFRETSSYSSRAKPIADEYQSMILLHGDFVVNVGSLFEHLHRESMDG